MLSIFLVVSEILRANIEKYVVHRWSYLRAISFGDVDFSEVHERQEETEETDKEFIPGHKLQLAI